MHIQANPHFEAWAKGNSGFQGGNPDGAVWFCGLEYGDGISEAEMDFSPCDEVPCVEALTLLSLHFCQLTRAQDVTSPSDVVDVPKYSIKNIEYPSSLVRLRIEGNVVVLFSVNSKSKAVDITAYTRDDQRLKQAAIAHFKRMEFELPVGWTEHGNDRLRFAVHMQFSISGRGKPCAEAVGPPFTSVSLCATIYDLSK